jgi:hypothetical protein
MRFIIKYYQYYQRRPLENQQRNSTNEPTTYRKKSKKLLTKILPPPIEFKLLKTNNCHFSQPLILPPQTYLPNTIKKQHKEIKPQTKEIVEQLHIEKEEKNITNFGLTC